MADIGELGCVPDLTPTRTPNPRLPAHREAPKSRRALGHSSLDQPQCKISVLAIPYTVDVPIYRPVVARPKRTGKQGKNARTCTRRADVSPQTSIWRVCVSPAVVVACNYSIISARVCNTVVHRRQQFGYDSSALSAQAGVHSIGTVPKT